MYLISGVVHLIALTMHLERFGMLLEIVCKYSITYLELWISMVPARK